MSTVELIEKIRALPKAERIQVAKFVARLDASSKRPRSEARDLAIINRRATRLNREAADVLDYQVPF
jgi:chorismate mutase